MQLALRFKTIAQSVALGLWLVVCSYNCGNKLEYNKRNGIYFVVYILLSTNVYLLELILVITYYLLAIRVFGLKTKFIYYTYYLIIIIKKYDDIQATCWPLHMRQ